MNNCNRLSDLEVKDGVATVIDVNSDGTQLGDGFKNRLIAMGLRKGKSVQVMRKAPTGDPYQVRVGSTTEIAIRKQEAKLVVIEKQKC
ncbi:MAG: ferrous iron transport protein A [Gammaproteobacteria bacterium]|nr:ferrous iron transport protein A [Gammaproteobacteria bacterium]